MAAHVCTALALACRFDALFLIIASLPICLAYPDAPLCTQYPFVLAAPITRSHACLLFVKNDRVLHAGGISPENVTDWLNAGAAAVGMGSCLVGDDVRLANPTPEALAVRAVHCLAHTVVLLTVLAPLTVYPQEFMCNC